MNLEYSEHRRKVVHTVAQLLMLENLIELNYHKLNP